MSIIRHLKIQGGYPMELIQDSIQRFLVKMKDVGYSQSSIALATSILDKFKHAHPNDGQAPFDHSIVEPYISTQEKKFESDLLGKRTMQKTAWFIKKFRDFVDSGEINPDLYTKPQFPLEEGMESVIDSYVSEVSSNPKQKKSRAWAPKRYAFWLLQHNIHSFTDIKVEDLRQFIIDDTHNLKGKTIPNFRSELRRFHVWLYDHKYIDHTFEELFDFRAAIEHKIHPAILPDEVAKILEQVDRSTATGKRDYAMLMCGVILGLRGCDIIKLQRTDIDWRMGEIRIAQHKTGKPLALPLTTDVAEALKDYLLNGRPEFKEPYIFIRHSAPIGPFTRGSALNVIFQRYKKLAGSSVEGGFYSLRRALGKNLTVAEVPITTVAQVLGHTDIANTKQYIALDTDHLKICALSFDGIEPKGWLE